LPDSDVTVLVKDMRFFSQTSDVTLVCFLPTSLVGLNPPNKTRQLGQVPSWIVKEFSSLLSPFMALLFSKSLDSGQYPKSFSHTVALPLLKKNMDLTQLNNYRPVSNLPFLSKLLEKAISERLRRLTAFPSTG